MSEKPAKARMGRPPKPVAPDAPTRTTYSVRLASSVRAALLDASDRSGRSISEEIESRLEASFAVDRNADLGDVVRQVAFASEQAFDGAPWDQDKALASYVYTRLCIVLAARMGVPVLRPDESRDVNFTVPGFSPAPQMMTDLKDAADLAWLHETTGFKRPSFAERLAQHQSSK